MADRQDGTGRGGAASARAPQSGGEPIGSPPPSYPLASADLSALVALGQTRSSRDELDPAAPSPPPSTPEPEPSRVPLKTLEIEAWVGPASASQRQPSPLLSYDYTNSIFDPSSSVEPSAHDTIEDGAEVVARIKERLRNDAALGDTIAPPPPVEAKPPSAALRPGARANEDVMLLSLSSMVPVQAEPTPPTSSVTSPFALALGLLAIIGALLGVIAWLAL